MVMRRALALLCSFCLHLAPVWAEDVTVFAAASLKTALDEVAEAYTARTGSKVTLSFAGSSALARQIQRGAPADVFLSANADWMDVLSKDGALAEGSRRDLLGNTLVVVSARPGPVAELSPSSDLRGWLGEGRLAMALVASVPAGQYGKAGLETLGLWDSVADRVAQADNVRAALALVSLGAAPLGVVYATDAAAAPGVHVRATFPPESHPPIVYPVAGLLGREAQSAPFLAFLSGPEAQRIFGAHGFGWAVD